MPPKKVQQPKELPLWGKPGNTLKMGIVGMPNVGKSTTFNLLSKMDVPAENYPFCTKEPNKATVPVPDERFDNLCKMLLRYLIDKGQVLQIVDIAGLVPGASKGQGLGNAFLSHIKDVDGIYHVLRAFDDPSVTHTEIEVDPVRDAQIIVKELVLKDLEYVNARIEDCEKKIKRNNDKEARQEKELLTKVTGLLNVNKWVRQGEWKAEQIAILNTHRLLTAKPVVYLVNLSEQDFVAKKNRFLLPIKNWVTNNIVGEIIPFSAEYEKKIFDAPPAKQSTAPKSMLSRIIRTGYALLDLVNFFTSGEDEVRAWTIRKRTKAPQAAGVIHTDFEKGFICAEVMKYTDLVELGNEHAVKTEGKYRQQGKDYIVQDGDIIFFKFNVGKGK